MSTRKKLPTQIAHTSGIRLQGYLAQGKKAKTYHNEDGFEWHLEIVESEPAAQCLVLTEEQATARAAAGFTDIHFGPYDSEVLEIARAKHLIIA